MGGVSNPVRIIRANQAPILRIFYQPVGNAIARETRGFGRTGHLPGLRRHAAETAVLARRLLSSLAAEI
jgi:hypothetical protein